MIVCCDGLGPTNTPHDELDPDARVCLNELPSKCSPEERGWKTLRKEGYNGDLHLCPGCIRWGEISKEVFDSLKRLQ